MASIIIIAAVAVLLARKGKGAAIDYSERSYGNCQQIDIPVYASAPGADYGVAPIHNDIDTIAFAVHDDTWTTQKGPMSVIKNTTIEGTYNIHGQVCVPKASKSSSNTSDILQIATHGLFYDGRYWDPEINRDTNSYVEAALKAGYAIFTYDRLGTGKSDKPDAYSVVQATFELEILHQITLMGRDGTLYDMAKKDAHANGAFQHLQPPKKVVHVGHSYGSILTSAYLVSHGSFSDGAILTGFIPNKELGTIGATAASLEYAATSRVDFSDQPSGYVVASIQGIQTIFFGGNPKTAFTKEMLEYGDQTKQPVAAAQWFSASGLQLTSKSSFKGPLQYMLAEFDYYLCRGDCKNTYDLSMLKKIFPEATTVDVAIQPNTGHGLTLHNNATAGYQVSLGFLSEYGL